MLDVLKLQARDEAEQQLEPEHHLTKRRSLSITQEILDCEWFHLPLV